MKIEPILARAGTSISELKKNPSAVIEAAGGQPVAILNRNKPAAYLIPAKAWEAIMKISQKQGVRRNKNISK